MTMNDLTNLFELIPLMLSSQTDCIYFLLAPAEIFGVLRMDAMRVIAERLYYKYQVTGSLSKYRNFPRSDRVKFSNIFLDLNERSLFPFDAFRITVSK